MKNVAIPLTAAALTVALALGIVKLYDAVLNLAAERIAQVTIKKFQEASCHSSAK